MSHFEPGWLIVIRRAIIVEWLGLHGESSQGNSPPKENQREMLDSSIDIPWESLWQT